MHITKCNRCKATIKNFFGGDGSSVRIYGKELASADFCTSCTPQLANFIKKFIETKKKR